MAVYQAWGMVTSDGFESYVQNTIARFDLEVERGLALLGQVTAGGVVSAARQEYKSSDEQLSSETDSGLWRDFYDSMPDFESNILGQCLVRELTNAERTGAVNPSRS